MTVRCAGCGYAFETHDLGTRRCHPATADKNGRRGTWREPPPVDRTPWHEIIARDSRARQAVIDDARRAYVPEVVPPPRIPARPPRGPAELAGYQGKQAIGLGRRAAAAGWRVAAHYAMRHDGTEFCAVKMQRDDLYAVATWTRKPGNAGKTSGWAADIAYGVKAGTMPVKLTHTELERIFDARAP